MEDPWHNWHKPEEASEMEAATVAGPTTPPECLGVSLVVEICAADLMLLEVHEVGGHGNHCKKR